MSRWTTRISAAKRNVWKLKLMTLPTMIIFTTMALLAIGSYSLRKSTPRHPFSSSYRSSLYYVNQWRSSFSSPDHLNESDYLTYHPPTKPSVSGKYFDEVNITTLHNLLPEPVELTKSNIDDFIFVTAISQTSITRFTMLVESVQQFFPTFKLIVYDLGLTTEQLVQLQGWCQVQIIKFDFSKYPPHVRSLYNYAFKPIAIAESMQRFDVSGIFWVAPSVRFLSRNISLIHATALRSQGVTVLDMARHSVFAVTPPEMYQYLPIIKDPMKSGCIRAGIIVLYKTNLVIDHVMHWWVACALSPTCIFLYKTRSCPYFTTGWSSFANCSQYDQSALSILLHNAYHDIYQVLHGKQSALLEVNFDGKEGKVKTCQNEHGTK